MIRNMQNFYNAHAQPFASSLLPAQLVLTSTPEKPEAFMKMDLTNACYFVQEKHIRRPYLAFDDVLGDALQVFSLF